jgi:hypothetical protein
LKENFKKDLPLSIFPFFSLYFVFLGFSFYFIFWALVFILFFLGFSFYFILGFFLRSLRRLEANLPLFPGLSA